MILLSGRGCVGRNVKYGAEGMQWRQSYKVQGSMVTKLHSLDCWHPGVGFLVKKTHSKGEFNFRSSWSIVYIYFLNCCHIETKWSSPCLSMLHSFVCPQFLLWDRRFPPKGTWWEILDYRQGNVWNCQQVSPDLSPLI